MATTIFQFPTQQEKHDKIIQMKYDFKTYPWKKHKKIIQQTSLDKSAGGRLSV
jgi:hypothetical protein